MAFAGSATCVLISLLTFVLLLTVRVQSQRSCTQTRSFTASQSVVTYSQQSSTSSYSCGWFNWRRCRQTTYSRRSMMTYRTVTRYRIECCSGYQCSGTPNCYACCSPNCLNGGTCISPNTCSCAAGWTDSHCQSDEDECQLSIDDCSVNAECENTVGSYTCSCNSGYSGSGQSCVDVNECEEEVHECSGDAVCLNFAGSYDCSCNHGYEGNGYNCFDIDECTTGESSCNQVCHNTKGSYYCSCNTGYYLESNTYTCSDINECADSNGGCHHSCVNTDGSYHCQCSDGYQLNADAHTCEVPPLPPTDVVVSGVGKRIATVMWSPPLVNFSNNLTAVAEYEIRLVQDQLVLPDIIVTIDSDSTLHTLNGSLEEFVEYTCTVRARNAFGWSLPSDSAHFSTSPDIPSGPPLNAAGVSESSTLLSLNWTAPNPVDVNGVLQYYLVSVKENETVRSWRVHAIDSFLFLGGLHPYYHYQCQVAAFTIGLGPFSPPVTILTHADVPSGAPSTPLIVGKSPHSLSLEWQPPSPHKQNGRVRYYNLVLTEIDTGNLLRFASNTTTTEVESLHPFYHYACRVQAVTTAPGPLSFGITVQLPESTPSEPPSNITGMAVNATAIYVSWESPNIESQNGIISHYSVSVTEVETDTEVTHMTELTVIEIRLLHPFYTYEITLSASTRAGSGPASQAIYITTQEDFPSGAPQNVSALSISPSSVIVRWTPPESQYQNGVILEYLVTVENGNSVELWSNHTELVVRNLLPHTVYSFAVAAINDIGVGPFSSPSVMRTLEDAPSRPPANITVSVLSPRSLALMWSPPDLAYQHGIITEYRLLLEIVELEVESIAYSTASTAVTLTDLHPHYTYSYKVAAHTVATGVYSEAATVQMPEDVPSSSPVALVVNNVTSTSAVLSWRPPPLEDQNGILTHFLANVTSVVTGESEHFVLQTYSTTIENLHPFYTYACIVSAATEVGRGPFSTIVEFRTEEAAPSGTPLGFTGTVIDSRTVVLSWMLPLQQELNGVVRSYHVNVESTNGIDALQLSTLSSFVSLQSLHPSYTYHFQVAAVTIDVGPFTEFITLKTLEDVPSGSPNNVLWEASSRSIYLTWSPPFDEDQNGVITGYTVRYAELGIDGESDFYSAYANVTIDTLEPFTSYGITVVAYTAVGPGPATQLLSVTTLEEAPVGQATNLSVVTVGKTSVHLEWEHPAEDTHYGVIREYRINVTELESGSVSRLFTDGEETEITIQSLHPYYTYHINIVPFTIEEGDNHTEITVRTKEDAPSMAPANVTVFTVLSTQVVLCWSPIPDPFKNGIIRHYVVNLTAEGTGNSELLNSLVTNITISGLKPYTKYLFSVAAYTVSTGPFSTESYVWTDQDVPSAPPEISSVTPLDPRTLAVSWVPPLAENLNGIVTVYSVNIVHLVEQNISVYTSATTELVVTDLQPFNRYSISIAAATVVGYGPQTQEYTIEMPEDAPTAPPFSLHVANVTASSALLSWLPPPPVHHNGLIRDYTINATEVNSGELFILTSQYTNITLDFLHPFYTYTLSVSAVTVLVGPFSDPLIFTTKEAAPSSAPTNLSAVNKTSTSIQLQWSPPPPSHQNGIITSYVVAMGRDDLQVYNSNFTDFTLPSLLPYTTYELKIASVNSAGRGPFTELISETTLEDAPGSPPMNVTLIEVTARSVQITWFEPEVQNGFIRYYTIKTSEQETGHVFHTSASVLEVTIPSLHPYYTYSFQVAAFTVSRGPYSSVYTVKTLEDVPSTYPNLTSLEAVNPNSLLLVWLPLTSQFANGIIENYVIRVYERNAITGVGLRNIEVSTNTTHQNIDDLHPYYNYLINLAAETVIGIGPFSNDYNITTPEDVPSSAPRNLSGEALDPTRVHISWSPPNYEAHNGIIRHYEVQVLEVPSGNVFTLQESGAYNEMTISTLHPYYEYAIKVAAATVGVGPFSALLHLTTLEDAPTGPPLNFSASVLNSSSCQLLWSSPDITTQNGIIRSYLVEVQENSASPQQFSPINTNATELVITDLHPAYAYSFRVAAETTDVGVFTSELTVVTLEDVPSQPPQFVGVVFQNASGIRLKWSAPAVEEQNGIITRYVLNITEHKTESLTNEYSYETDIFLTLDPFSEFTIAVSASTQIGPGPFSETVFITTAEQSPSGPPVDIALELLSSTSIVLTWSPVPQAQQNGIIRRYAVEVVELLTDEPRVLSTLSNSLSLNIDNLHPFYTYTLSVSGVTVSAGPYSTPLSVTTRQDVPSGPPSNITVVSVESRSYTIDWLPPLPDQQNGIIQSYLLWVLTIDTDEQVEVLVPASEELNRTYTVLDLHPYYAYNFTLRAVTIGSGVESGAVSVQLLEEVPTEVPQNVTFTIMSATSLQLSWTSPPKQHQNGRITFYAIEMDVVDTEARMDMNSNETSVVLKYLHPFYTYSFAIAAANSVGLGPLSNASRVQMPESSPTGAVSNFTALVNSSTEVTLSWIPQDPNMWNGIILNYTILCDLLGPIGYDSVEDNFTTTIKFTNFTQNTVDPRLASGPPLLESILISHLLEHYKYRFTVYMYNSAGRSERSTQLVVQLPGAAPSGPPTSVVVHVASSTSLELSWGLPALVERNGVVLGYVVTIADQAHSISNQYNISGTHLTVHGLHPFKEYLIAVRAWSDYGLGPQSNIVTAQTPEDVPGSPMNVSVLQVNKTSVIFSWRKPANPNGVILSYEIVYSGKLSSTESTVQKLADGPYNITVNGSVNAITICNLKQNLTYTFKVRAATGVGYGEYSLTATNNKQLDQQLSNSTKLLSAFTVLGWALVVVIISVSTALCLCYWRSGRKRNRQEHGELQFRNVAFKTNSVSSDSDSLPAE